MRASGVDRRIGFVVRLVGLGIVCLMLGNCASSNTARLDGSSRVAAAADARSPAHGHVGLIECNERGCSDRVKPGATTAALASYASLDDGGVVGSRPDGCPRSFCGCEASRYVFGKVYPELNLASNWMKFPRSSPASGMAAVRNHHVMVLISHAGGNDWLVHDGNSGGGLTRNHVMSISGYTIVNPNGT